MNSCQQMVAGVLMDHPVQGWRGDHCRQVPRVRCTEHECRPRPHEDKHLAVLPPAGMVIGVIEAGDPQYESGRSLPSGEGSKVDVVCQNHCQDQGRNAEKQHDPHVEREWMEKGPNLVNDFNRHNDAKFT